MDGVHDLGGMQNFGPVQREENEPVFHDEWEGLVFAYTLATLGAGYCRIDELRRSNELMPPADYLAARYFERWLFALESILKEKTVLTPDEIASGKSLRDDGVALPPVTPEKTLYAMTNPMPSRLKIDLPPRFRPGDEVVARNMTTSHHTRLPRYIRGRRGTVETDHGVFLLPDTNAHGGPEKPQTSIPYASPLASFGASKRQSRTPCTSICSTNTWTLFEMAAPDLSLLPGIPSDEDGPVFSAPWQAQAFAMAVKLQAEGVFTWGEWADEIGASIATAHASGDPDLGDTYYEHWLAALERLAAKKGLTTTETLAQRKEHVLEEHRRVHEHEH